MSYIPEWVIFPIVAFNILSVGIHFYLWGQVAKLKEEKLDKGVIPNVITLPK